MLSENTFRFLAVNKMNDSREWFKENKEEYEAHVLQPLKELCEALAPLMLSIDAQIVTDAKIGKTISRIYRDTRFSRDKSIFRDVMWLVFARDRNGFPDAPAFVFEMCPRFIRWGVGYYSMPAKLMDAARELILENHPLYRQMREDFNSNAQFTIVGEEYKKEKHQGESAFAQSLLNRKSISFLRVSDDFSILKENFEKQLEKDFLHLKSAYAFLLAASERYRMKEENV